MSKSEFIWLTPAQQKSAACHTSQEQMFYRVSANFCMSAPSKAPTKLLSTASKATLLSLATGYLIAIATGTGGFAFPSQMSSQGRIHPPTPTYKFSLQPSTQHSVEATNRGVASASMNIATSKTAVLEFKALSATS